MIMQPDFVTVDDFNKAKEVARKKKDIPLIDKVRFESFTEGKSAQIMHMGHIGRRAGHSKAASQNCRNRRQTDRKTP